MAVTERKNISGFDYFKGLMGDREGVRSRGGISIQVIRERAWEGRAYIGPHLTQLWVNLYQGEFRRQNFVQGFRIKEDWGVVGELSNGKPLVEPFIESDSLKAEAEARKRRVQDVATFVRTVLEQPA